MPGLIMTMSLAVFVPLQLLLDTGVSRESIGSKAETSPVHVGENLEMPASGC